MRNDGAALVQPPSSTTLSSGRCCARTKANSPAKARVWRIVGRVAWDVGVDRDVPPHALLEEADSHQTLAEVVLADEKLLHETQPLRGAKDRKRRQEVAVAKGALYDVVGLCAAVARLVLCVVQEQVGVSRQLRRALPTDLRKSGNRRGAVRRRAQRSPLRR